MAQKPALILVVLLMALAGVGVAAAQQPDLPEGCDLLGAIDDVQSEFDSNPVGVEAILDVFTNAANTLTMMRTTCEGLVFEGTGDRVLGPIELLPGLYRVVVQTDGYVIGDIQVISGACEAQSFMGLFLESPGHANDGAEALVTSEGCTAVVTISNITEPWTLRFEKIT